MPEGPELKLSADLIRPLVSSRIITGIDFPESSRYHNESPDGFAKFSEHFSYQDKNYTCKIQSVQCKGKFMYWSLSDDWYVFITYGMTGQLSPQRGKHVCMRVSLDDDPSIIYFNDPRHFGTIKFIHGEQELNKKLKELGWDPLGDDGVAYLNTFNKTSMSNKPVGQLLMDQKLFAGVGNYIRAEALYAAELSPWRPGNTVKADQLVRLFDALKAVMQESYQYQGATLLTYKTAFGEEGKYSSCFKVYNQKQDPLGNPIVKETTPEGRTIHWCPSMQK